MTTLVDLTKKKGKFIIFKHSTTCPISLNAKDEIQKYKALPKALKIITILVLKQIKLKLEIAKHYKVKHESPQILLIDNQVCVKNFSHYKVTLKNLKNL